ncbi:hypothetical protein ASG74_00550 [Knoellia sp. Soil729]|nr:hypothetical protein ASG74_00550 [Knoellia sp. Soil729]
MRTFAGRQRFRCRRKAATFTELMGVLALPKDTDASDIPERLETVLDEVTISAPVARPALTMVTAAPMGAPVVSLCHRRATGADVRPPQDCEAGARPPSR